jgi:predicted TIM-barrel fold metal-dependent hydrolase
MAESPNHDQIDYDQIDCDSHVQEAGGTWETYLNPAYADRRPTVIDNPFVSGRPHRNKTWYIDGQLVPKNQGNGGVVMSTPVEMDFAQSKPVPPDVQSCADPVARARATHAAGIRRTVLFTTLFLQTFLDDVDYEAALFTAWTRWMSDMQSAAPDTIAFAAPVPLRDPSLAVESVKGARENGAAAVMVLPTAGEMLLHDRRLDRFWAACQDFDMPVAVHIGWPQPWVTDTCTTPSTVFLGAFDTSMWWAYVSVLTGGILDRFPNLRIAFMENDSRFFEVFMARAMHWFPTSAAKPWPTTMSPMDVLRERRVYFSYEGDYALLPRFMDLVGEDRVMAALDFPHTHYGTASLSASFDFVRNHTGVSAGRKRRLLRDVALEFYGWSDFTPASTPAGASTHSMPASALA